MCLYHCWTKTLSVLESSKYYDSTSSWGDVTRGVDLINQLG